MAPTTNPGGGQSIYVGDLHVEKGATGIKIELGPAASAADKPRFWNIPLLPPEYIPPSEAAACKAALLSPAGGDVVAVVGQKTALAVQGMGGVGKTLLATQLANDPDVRAAFDGIFWISIGRERAGSIENTLGLQADLAQAISGQRPS